MRARARTALASALLLTFVTACSDATGDESPEKDPTPGAPSSSTSAPTPTLDADHVVEMPGPITGIQGPPDILVVSTERLADDVVDAIARLDNVTTERLSLAQTFIENEALNVAAVNPATYRNFTAPKGAQTQAIWERVAGGELAVEERLKDKLPEDENGFLRIGSADDDPSVHIGAYAPQVVQVDAVVNQTWTDELGMVEGNALLVRTGKTAPKTAQKLIEKLVGGGASVSLVDKATRFGVDPGVKQVAVTTGTVADVVGVFRYTVLGGGRIAPEQSWVESHIITKTVPILGQVTCNKYLFPQLEAALNDVVASGLQDEIHPGEYAGCYYPRFIAGTTKLSNHSFGLALDLNTPGNQRGTVGEMDRGVVAIFKHWGFGWGGDWSYTDPMHFEMVELKTPENP